MGTSPQKIGRYEIVGELGKGAMGLVYKALDPMIGRTVAMKTMRMDVHGMESDEMLKRFQNEARAAGVLNHANIVTIYDAGEQDGLFYIAMEFIEGVTLHSEITQNRVLPVEQIIDVSRQVCAGLDVAHSHGVVHRDVKPANIMITPDKTVKIMDFGIAKAGGGLTSAGQVLGTPNYMSPEQVKGRTLDGRSDLFSFGVILYEMVTGEKPFTGQNVTTIIYKIVNENPIPPRELDVTIHPGLSAVITRALAKSPDERYQNGAELLRDLVNYKSFGASPDTTSVMSAGAGAAASALNANASDKTVVFDSGAMQKMGSGSQPAASGPAAAAAKPAVAPLQAIDSTVDMARKKVAAAAKARAPKDPKMLLMLGGGILAVLLVIGGIGWARHRSSQQQAAQAEQQRTEAQQRTETQQKQQIEQQVQNAPAPTAPASTTPPPADAQKTPAAAAAKTGKTTTPAKTTTTQAKSTTPATPTPAAPAATTGELQITSNPAGAQVQVDSSLQGTSPFNAKSLTPGQHTVVISKTGYQSATRVIEVAAGKSTPLAVTLAVVPMATLSLASQPAGASILVDEKDTGKVTPAQLPIEAGEHKLILRKQGFKDATMNTPRLAAGQTFNFAPLLQAGKEGDNPFKRLFGGIPEGKGMANLKTTPKGAQVSMNGFTAPNRTPAKLPLDPGSYEITFKLDGYKPATKSVTVEKGKTADIQVTLEKQ
ncbi:MAG: serine/threonine protein kinase [Candidatus Koribacter versatilis]|uniref:non-specific serine/threonine protein kinase n=1 Tax=Candidatus Korobacter versatilis TaxID=658062 RepID=A0A932EP86_9BACT|nr:serine/threonine protein kinase [Candidatus Koribacter versatilis]